MEEILRQILKELQHPNVDIKSVSIKEAAKILGISWSKLKSLMDAGLIRYMITSPRQGYQIPLWEIKRFQEQYMGYDLSDPWNPVKFDKAS